MQLFGKRSEEGSAEGLGWIDAVSRRFTPSPNHRVPHMGWNTLQLCKPDPLLEDMAPRSRFYFVHSFYVDANDPRDVLAQTTYGTPFTSAVSKKNIWGMQFHPEKSLKWGMQVLGKFADYA
jgi:glutamine amidotransferase